MAKKCEVCHTPLRDKTNRFCPIHAKAKLVEMEKAGYLEPLEYTTSGGVQKISTRRFLTLKGRE